MDRDLGQATIVYEDPGGEPIERTVKNEHLAYFQDHWVLKIGEDDGNDEIRRIPHTRVYYVDRSVEAFEDEVKTTKEQVQSIADDLRRKLLGGRESGDTRERDPVTVDIEDGESTESRE